MDDYDGQMIFGELMGLKLPDICLTGEGNPRKTSPRKLVSNGDRTGARCVTDAACYTACSTAMDVLHCTLKNLQGRPMSVNFSFLNDNAAILWKYFTR